jgi:CRISPR-associated protein Cmr1
MDSVGRRPIPELGEMSVNASLRETHVYELRLATPMFGGGIIAGQIDRRLPIRGSTIRGHLRWWWRLLNKDRPEFRRATGECDISKMRTREFEIWGSAESPSPVQVIVKRQPTGPVEVCGHWCQEITADKKSIEFVWSELFQRRGLNAREKSLPPLPYALFPFSGVAPAWNQRLREYENFNTSHCSVSRNCRKHGSEFIPNESKFAFEINFPKTFPHAESVLTTIVSWIRYGGIGARTRRGCGALRCTSVKLEELSPPPGCQLYLGKEVGISSDSAIVAWVSAIELLQNFRQTDYRNPGKGVRPGRSWWPEADSIRHLTERRLKRHLTPNSSVGNCEPGTFPKAVLGLPIIYHFQRERDVSDEENDPEDVTICPSGVGRETGDARMASPLILRPLFVPSSAKKDVGTWVPAIIVLPNKHLETLTCQLKSDDELIPPGRKLVPNDLIRGPKLSEINVLKQNASDNALDAFLNYARKHGFRQVEA